MNPFFVCPPTSSCMAWSLLYAVLGVLGGLVSAAFVKLLLGMITASQLDSAVDDAARFRTVSEIMTPPPQGPLDTESFPHIHPDHSLDMALERMGDIQLDALPVVSRANVREILGVISLTDILRGIAHSR